MSADARPHRKGYSEYAEELKRAMAYLAGSAPVFAASAQRGARGSRPVIVQESHVPRVRTNHLNRIPSALPPPAQTPEPERAPVHG